MKRLFTVVSSLMVSIFFVWVFTIWSDTYVSYFYPNVSVFSVSSETSFDQISRNLEKLASDTDSFIAMQHQESGPDGRPVFSYTPFGKGKLPSGLVEKPITDASSSSVLTNYFIFSGQLDPIRLKSELSDAGVTLSTILRPSHFGNIVRVFVNGFQVLALLIFWLTFAALSLIGQIKSLKVAGIRLISGETNWKIFLESFKSDCVNVGLSLVCSSILAVFMYQFLQLPMITLHTIVFGLMIYQISLLVISFILSSIFALGINKIHLMKVIKGQIPVRGIISLILLAQLLAVVIVSLSVQHTTIYTRAWQQHQLGHDAWRDESQMVMLLSSRDGVDPRQEKDEIERKQKVWYNLIHEAVSQNQGMLVYHQLVAKMLANGLESASVNAMSNTWDDYTPTGNVLIVTPDYLKRQQVNVTPEIERKVTQLGVGEFVLLLPEHLRGSSVNYQTLFEQHLANHLSHPDKRQSFDATIFYIENNVDRFLYNMTPISYQQFLKDPIIVVLTPQSTGDQTLFFWEGTAASYFLFNDLKTAQSLVDKYTIHNWVSEFTTGYHHYQQMADNLKREIWTTVLGALLSVSTAVLMFYTMNKLYFQEFRRDIFIKRLSGLRFLEIHRYYLLAQVGIFIVACLASILLRVPIPIALSVLCLFVILSVLQLWIQMITESKQSMIVLKGA